MLLLTVREHVQRLDPTIGLYDGLSVSPFPISLFVMDIKRCGLVRQVRPPANTGSNDTLRERKVK